MKVGQRVFWHGVFPDPKRSGTIKRTGDLRHEVQWDGSTDVSLEAVGTLMAVAKFGKCCPYCESLQAQATDK